MNLEPAVIESIKKHRRKVMARKAQFFLPLFLGCAFLVAIVLSFLVSQNRDSNDTKGFILFAVVIIIPVIVTAVSIRRANKKFKNYTGRRLSFRWPTNVGDTTRGIAGDMRKFRSALDGVCIGAGVTAPELVAISDDSVNAFAFVDDTGTRIAITEGMLEAPLSIHEINAIIAHELSHTIIGNNVKEPGFSDIEYYPGIFYGNGVHLCMICLILLGAVIVCLASGGGGNHGLFVAGFILILVSIPFLSLFVYRAFHGGAVKGLDSLHIEDDLLADSIAVKITMNPDALESAIKIVKDINESHQHRSRGPSIDGIRPEAPDFMTKYFFVGPPGSLTAYHQKTSGDSTEQTSLQIFHKKKNTAREPVDERIKNLEFIKKGRWPAFEK